MKISGFIFGKNVTKLYYPIKQAIQSILPICDEFIVVLGDCDPDDNTRAEILSINSPKIRIIETVWDINKYPKGAEMAHQTDIAKSYCTGDWLFCIQADEIAHEKDLPKIKARCEQLLHDKEVEGLLFRFIHFWGDYEHYCDSHGWHKHEIRIIRNNPDIHSWRDSMSFRRIPNFDGISYSQKRDTFKLKVAEVDACIYHYGWVRPLEFMKSKIKEFNTQLHGIKETEKHLDNFNSFDYGNLEKYEVFKGTHPEIMKDWIAKFNWKDKLHYHKELQSHHIPHKQERLKYRFVTFLEKHIFFRPLWEFKNYTLVKRKFKV
jgi:hypothetical protein